MKYGLSIATLSVGVFILAGAGLSFAEDSSVAPAAETSAPSAPAVASSAVAAPAANEPDVLWLWGDVVAVDAQKNELTVKYLDYESDNEKEIPVTVNDKTAYENAKTLAELKAQDTVSVDYVVVDGKNIAKNISVEKPESIEPAKEEAPVTDMPDAQPAGQVFSPDQPAPETKSQAAE